MLEFNDIRHSMRKRIIINKRFLYVSIITIGLYLLGSCVPSTIVNKNTFQKAEAGDAEAQMTLAYAYVTGRGVVRDPEEAFKWYRKAADQGNPRAQKWLGMMYGTGFGVPINCEESRKWAYMAAVQEDPTLEKHRLVATTKAVNLIREEHVRKYKRSELLKMTVYGFKDDATKGLTVLETGDELTITCGNESTNLSVNVSDDSSLVESFARMRPIVTSCVNEKFNEELSVSYEHVLLKEMMSSLETNSSFFSCEYAREMWLKEEDRPKGVIGVRVREKDGSVVIVHVFEDTLASRSGLRRKDVIEMIGDEPANDMSVPEVWKRLRGEPGTEVILSISRKGEEEPIEFTLTREIVEVENVRHKTLDGGYAYVKVRDFRKGTSGELNRILQESIMEGEVKGLILDLRDNDGGSLEETWKIADSFIDSGILMSTKGRGKGQSEEYTARGEGTYCGFPMAVLVNDETAAGAEAVTGTLQEHGRATIVGETTYGRGSVVSFFTLPGGSTLRLTTAYLLTGMGKEIEGKGIEPDVVITDEIDRDVALNRAHKIVKEKSKGKE